LHRFEYYDAESWVRLGGRSRIITVVAAEQAVREAGLQTRRETAKALKAMGLSVGQIAMSTKLSAEEIAAL
jgi:hypothetical protein